MRSKLLLNVANAASASPLKPGTEADMMYETSTLLSVLVALLLVATTVAASSTRLTAILEFSKPYPMEVAAVDSITVQ